MKIRRALSKPDKGAHAGAGGVGQGGAATGRGKKRLSKKDQAALAAAEKRAQTAAAKAMEKKQAAQTAALLQAQKRLGQAGGKGKARARTCAGLSEADTPRVVAQTVARALELPAAATALPKDVLALAREKMPDVAVDDLAPKPALLLLAKAIVAAGK